MEQENKFTLTLLLRHIPSVMHQDFPCHHSTHFTFMTLHHTLFFLLISMSPKSPNAIFKVAVEQQRLIKGWEATDTFSLSNFGKHSYYPSPSSSQFYVSSFFPSLALSPFLFVPCSSPQRWASETSILVHMMMKPLTVCDCGMLLPICGNNCWRSCQT